MKRFFLFLIFPFAVKAQFAPAAGLPGSTAIHKDSSIIVGWATGCTVKRGNQNIQNPSAGTTTVGVAANACGPADITGVVSLGDEGSAVLTFQSPIRDLPGPDFCVFENAFDPGFLELAFVEVSSDGINFARFPAISNTQNTVQIGPFDTSNDASNIHNLAGKYIGGYGVPFDLQELQGTAGLDIDNITHVKIIDVIGCIQGQFGTFDSNNNVINDLWPTEFPSGGFDLDAVGVIHQQPVSVIEQSPEHSFFKIFPTITNDFVRIISEVNDYEIELRNASGTLIMKEKNRTQLNLETCSPGVYFVVISSKETVIVRKVVKI